MRHRAHLLRAFIASRHAVSAIEFAIVLPVLIILMLGGFQLALYVNATRSVEAVAESVAQMISEFAPPTNATTTATVAAKDLHFGYDSTLVVFPYVMKDAARKQISWWQDITISFASVSFSQKSGTTCSGYDKSACYDAKVVWTSSGSSGANARACGSQQTAADDTAPPSPNTLPRSVFGDGSIIAVDVVFTFKPTFAAQILPSIRIARSVFVQPRYATLIAYDTTANDGIAAPCST